MILLGNLWSLCMAKAALHDSASVSHNYKLFQGLSYLMPSKWLWHLQWLKESLNLGAYIQLKFFEG